MAGKFNMGLILLVAFAGFLQISAATTYTVGDSTGWTVLSDPSAYATWAAGKTFVVGDILVFNFATGSHDVAEVMNSGYDDCDSNNPISLDTTGPVIVDLTSAGDKYYICTFGRHCSLGQKLAITVSSAAPSPSPMASTPIPSSSPSIAPSPRAATPPPTTSTPAPATSPRASSPAPSRAPTPIPAMGPSPPPRAQPPSSTASPPSTATPPTMSSGATPPTSGAVPSTPSETNGPPPSSAPASLGATGVFAAFLTIAVAVMIQ